MSDEPVTLDIAHGVPTIAVSSTSTLANRTGSWKHIRPIYQDRVAPCNAACPVGIDIEAAMNLLRQGRVAEARSLFLRENPMPSVTGRVCEHPCHGACSRASFDEAVNIRSIERMLGDFESEDPVPALPRRRERVAVVGSGPAGLACAYHLATLGYGVTVYEADPEPGGWLRYGVPEYKLPRAVLKRAIDRILARGIALQCGTRIGHDVPWRELERFDAVYIATGARQREAEAWDRRDAAQVQSGLDFLRELSLGAGAGVGRRVVIVGGTDLAVDCARSARRIGRDTVVVFQGRREDMSASAEAIDDAHREGVRFEFMAKPVGLQVREHAEDETALEAIGTMFDAEAAVASHPRVVGLACVRLQATSPASVGTKRPMSIPSSSFVIPADVLVTALGAEPQAEFLPPDPHARGYIVKTDPFGHTNREAVFAGGDVTGEPHTIAHSLGAGKRGAIGIDHLLRTRAGETTPALDARALCYGGTGSASITRWRGDDPVSRTNELNEVVPFSMLNMAYFEHEPMRHDRHAGAATAVAESNLGLAPEDALAEAKRCFNCGVCNDCDVCRVLCPDVAIKRHGGGPGYSLSYKYCKGCGLCVEECPRGAMTMTREGL